MGFQSFLTTYGPNYLTALSPLRRITAVPVCARHGASPSPITVLRVCPFKRCASSATFYVQVFHPRRGPHPQCGVRCRTSLVLTTSPASCSARCSWVRPGSENFMTGINTIGVGRIEAARPSASSTRILRHVVIPQALGALHRAAHDQPVHRGHAHHALGLRCP